MYLRLLRHSLLRRGSRKAAAVAAVWVGLSLVVALVTLGLDVGDKMYRELRAFGANIRVEPLAAAVPVGPGVHRTATAARAYLEQGDLRRLKEDLFWRHNIVGYVGRLWTEGRVGERPIAVLGVTMEDTLSLAGGGRFVTGVRRVYGHWHVAGAWPAARDECLLGVEAARVLGLGAGDTLTVAGVHGSPALRVSGVVSTGERRQDAAVVAPLSTAQRLAGLPGRISAADVSALTTPEDDLATRYARAPESLTPEDYERWSCTPYPGVVAAEIQSLLPGSVARVVRRVAETEGVIMARIDGLVFLLVALTLATCVLSVAGVLAAAVRERHEEVALLRALGGHRGSVLGLFLGEAAVVGSLGGALAGATGLWLGRWLVSAVFAAPAGTHLLPATAAPLVGLLVAWMATYLPIRRLLAQDVAGVLHGT